MLNVIMDLQYGSSGKGLLAGYLAKKNRPGTVITAWAANAGHTFIDNDGRKYVHTMVANGVVSPGLKRLMIGPGSVIDPLNLAMELASVVDHLANVRVMIHPQAAVILQRHRDEEAGFHAIGSTKKGVGAAMIERIRRDPATNNSARNVFGPNTELHSMVCTEEQWVNAIAESYSIQVEGAQGYGLSMYHGHYPYTTSRDVTTAQLIADCGLPFNMARNDMTVWGTARTYPIRVANRFDEHGNQIGWSGPCMPDQHELDWKDLGMQAELTTVTKLPRRIFTFSAQQIVDAVRMNGVNRVFLNFVNYCKSDEEVNEIVDSIYNAGTTVALVGLGPKESDVVRLQEFAQLSKEEREVYYRKGGTQ